MHSRVEVCDVEEVNEFFLSYEDQKVGRRIMYFTNNRRLNAFNLQWPAGLCSEKSACFKEKMGGKMKICPVKYGLLRVRRGRGSY